MTTPEHTSAGHRIHGNYVSPARYEADSGVLDETTTGQQPDTEYQEWINAKAGAEEITEGAGANGV